MITSDFSGAAEALKLHAVAVGRHVAPLYRHSLLDALNVLLHKANASDDPVSFDPVAACPRSTFTAVKQLASPAMLMTAETKDIAAVGDVMILPT